MWLVAIVGFFNGQNWVSDGSVCVRCAPSWTTTFGRVLYVLLAICILLLIWRFGAFRSSDMTPNPSIQSGRPQAGAADFRRYTALETARLEIPALWPSVAIKSP
jgi:hypothetical protein